MRARMAEGQGTRAKVGVSRRGWTRLGAAALRLVVTVAPLVASTGCAALSALTNPGAAWALNEPAPMGVVMRRAEVARATSREVRRLLDDTPVDEKSAWIDKVALDKAAADEQLARAALDPVYVGQPAPMRIVPAEAWALALGGSCGEAGGKSSVIAALGTEVEEQYDELASEVATLAELKGALDKEKAAIDAPKATAEEKKQHETERDRIEKQIREIERQHDPKVDALLAKVKTEAAKVDGPLKDKLKVLVAALARAVDDAKTANAVALVRYPIAMPGMTSDVQAAAKRFAADVVEEKTGHRPTMTGLAPSVALDGTDVKLTLNGVPADQLGKMSVDEFVGETTKRTKDYVGKVLSLVGDAGETQETLAFEADLLEALATGFGPGQPAPAFGDPPKMSDPKAAGTEKRAQLASSCRAHRTDKPKPTEAKNDKAGDKAAKNDKPADKSAKSDKTGDKTASKPADGKTDKSAGKQAATKAEAQKPAATKPAVATATTTVPATKGASATKPASMTTQASGPDLRLE